jgi:hypothetical protein
VKAAGLPDARFAGCPVLIKCAPQADHHIVESLCFIFGLEGPPLAKPQGVNLLDGEIRTAGLLIAPQNRMRPTVSGCGQLYRSSHIGDVRFGRHDGFNLSDRLLKFINSLPNPSMRSP